MTARARSKYADSSSRTASGSRLSDNGVKPTRSANSNDTIRRSDTGVTAGAEMSVVEGAGAAVTVGASSAPHSLQKRPPETGALHCGHVTASGVPHSEQNFAPGRLTAPQPAQASSAMRTSREAANVRGSDWTARRNHHFGARFGR